MSVCIYRPPLWSSGQSSWLQIWRPGFDSRHYQKKKKVAGLERGALSLVSTTEELLDRKVGLLSRKARIYGRRDPSRWPHGTLYLHKLAITSPTSGGCSVGIVRSRTQTMEFFFFCVCIYPSCTSFQDHLSRFYFQSSKIICVICHDYSNQCCIEEDSSHRPKL
jgi:hypothetical protein